MKSVTLEQLLEAGSHFGHQARRWNPRMKSYLYGVQGGVHLFDLAQTKEGLDTACKFVNELGQQGKVIIFIGTKRQAADVVREEAKKIKVLYVVKRWLGGTITNWDQIRGSIRLLIKLREEKEAGKLTKYTKKEQLLLDRKMNRLNRFFEGLIELESTPDALFIVDVKAQISAVKEARKKGIPIIAIVDSNVDPALVDYIIPANDDAIKSIKLIVTQVMNAYAEGRAKFEKAQAARKKKEESAVQMSQEKSRLKKAVSTVNQKNEKERNEN
ncbi:30S ribosomal protein S2 [Patescibacteria group bacterium]|nr:30S ribosomal protein S2 [Patescibacteria group bacterium]